MKNILLSHKIIPLQPFHRKGPSLYEFTKCCCCHYCADTDVAVTVVYVAALVAILYKEIFLKGFCCILLLLSTVVKTSRC